MGQQPRAASIMNQSAGASAKASARASGYHQKAMAEIHNSLLPFAKTGGGEPVGSSAASTISTLSTTSGVSSASGHSSGSNGQRQNAEAVAAAVAAAAAAAAPGNSYADEALRALQLSGGRIDAIDLLVKQSQPQELKNMAYTSKLIRKPSLERELSLHRGSPALDSGAGSSRSDSPRLSELHPQVSRQYSPSEFGEPPPLPPPRGSNTPPPPPASHFQYQPVPSNVQQLFKRMSPAPIIPSRPSPVLPVHAGSNIQGAPSGQRGTSPVASSGNVNAVNASSRQPMVVQNGPQVQQQLSQQMQALSLYQTGASNNEPPPPYPLIPSSPSVAPPPPSYSASIQSRQSPTQDYRKSPSSGIYSGPTSAGSPSPIPVSTATPPAMARPTPLQAWSARQAKTQPPIIMQSVKSTQVQKPVLQTAIAPTSPQIPPTSTQASPSQPPPPSYASSIQQKQHVYAPKPAAVLPQQSPTNNTVTTSAISVPTTEPPSYASTMQALAVQRGITHHPAPPPPYANIEDSVVTVESSITPRMSHHHQPLQRKYSPVISEGKTVSYHHFRHKISVSGARIYNGGHMALNIYLR